MPLRFGWPAIRAGRAAPADDVCCAPLGALRDLACGLAGHDQRHVENLGRFRGDVLIFVEGTGFGPAMFDTAALFE